jgi:pyruvate dehydrogenase E2 component (dihydrolipoamide acetyltransferase)
MTIKEVIIPKLGQTMETGTIVEWLKQEGDPVARGEVLFSLDSDKATLEVESPGKGYLRKILVPSGIEKPVLTVIGLITKSLDEDISGYKAKEPSVLSEDKTEERETTEIAEVSAETAQQKVEESLSGRIFISPRAKKLATEKGLRIAEITGSGPNGRIVEHDVLKYIELLPKVTPVAKRVADQTGVDLRKVVATGYGGRITKHDVEAAKIQFTASATSISASGTTNTPLSGVRAIIARRMFEGHKTTAPVTLTTEADATDLVTMRERLKISLAKELGFNLGYNDLLIKIVAYALREFPYMNARLEGEVIQQLSEVHIGLAVDTERGLIVPVVRDADRKGIKEIAQELRNVIDRVRTNTVVPDELSGSTFTITNLGMYDIDAFTPIINMPETAILGVGRIKKRPAVVDGQVIARQMIWLSLTFDHRLVDGAPAARFLQRVKQLVEEPYLIIS